MGKTVQAVWDQDSFAWYADSGAEGTGQIGSTNSDPTTLVNETQYRLRYLIQETAGATTGDTPTFVLYYRADPAGGTNFGSWTPVDSDDQYFTAITSSNVTDAAATTQQIGAGTFRDGEFVFVDADGAASTALSATAGNDEYEIEWVLEFAVGAYGVTFEFQVQLSGGALDTYTATTQVKPLGTQPVTATWDQDSFRFYDDDGGAETSTALAALNTNVAIGLDTPFQLRFLIQETNGSIAGEQLYIELRYDIDTGSGYSGTWTQIATSGFNDDPVTGYDTLNLTEGQAAAQRIGSGTFTDGIIIDASRNNFSMGALSATVGNDEFEVHFGLILDSGSSNPASNGDKIKLRLYYSYDTAGDQLFDTYTNIPEITVGASSTITGSGNIAFPGFEMSGAGVMSRSGSGALGFPALVASGTGDVVKVGSGSLALPALALSGAGAVGAVVDGSGALGFPALALSGTGDVVKVGAGALDFPALSLSGAGDVVKVGSGSLAFPALSLSGAGDVVKVGSGALGFPALAVDGTGAVGAVVDGSGALDFPALSLSGTGDVAKVGSGALGFTALSVSGAGSAVRVGSGDLAVPPLSLSGAGSAVKVGSGALGFGAFTVNGTGGVAGAVSGDGALSIPALSIEGAGVVARQATGDVAFPALALSGTGDVVKVGSGALGFPALSLSGAGGGLWVGSGALAFPAIAVDGAGASSGEVSGSGTISFPAFAFLGAAIVARQATGDLAFPALSLSGNGDVVKVGSGALGFPALSVDGSGQVSRSASGDLRFAAFVIDGRNFVIQNGINVEGAPYGPLSIVGDVSAIPSFDGQPVAPYAVTGSAASGINLDGAPSGAVQIIGRPE